jgi:cytochrome c peroxidase
MLKSRASKSAVFVLALFGWCTDDNNHAVEPELGQVKQALNFTTASQACSQDTRVQLGIVTQDECVGAELFFRDEFAGNGRSCASCHPAANNYTIDPTFIAQLPASDPLFVAEQVPALAGLERPDLLRNHGLILENVDGVESPTTKFTMRSVPHTLGLSTSILAPVGTGPQERTGWSGDGAPGLGRLKDFQTGAIFQHYPLSLNRVEDVDFVQADEAELTAIDAFMKTIGRTNELDLALVTLSDAGAQAGRGSFMEPAKRCNGCHSNAGANLASGINQNFNTGVETVRLGILDVQGIPFDGGFGGQGLASFNFDANGDGTNDSFGNGAFNTPPLVEAADTGPFFHTNAFDTIEEAVAFYRTAAFTSSPAGAIGAINMTNTEVANIGRFLRVLNAALNVQMALGRVDAALSVIEQDKNQSREMQQELLKLARVEAEDALQVLSGVSALNTSAQGNLTSALALLQTASTHASHTQRKRNAEDARAQLVTANTSLGTGMTFVMGGGTFLF